MKLSFHPDHNAIFLSFQAKADVLKLALPKNVTSEVSFAKILLRN